MKNSARCATTKAHANMRIVPLTQVGNTERLSHSIVESDNDNGGWHNGEPSDENPSPDGAGDPTDVAVVDLFVQQHGQYVVYCRELGGWLAYDGTRWMANKGEIYRRLVLTIRGLYTVGAGIENGSQRRTVIRNALKMESATRIHALLKLAELALSVSPDRFDANSSLLNLANGTYDFKRNKLRKHLAKDFITKLIPITFGQRNICPIWTHFLERVFNGDSALISFVQKLMAYTLAGETNQRLVVLLIGIGQNGKSTLLDIFRLLLGLTNDGGYAHKINPLALQKGFLNLQSFEIAAMRGARFVYAGERTGDANLDVNCLKELTGNEIINARHPHGRPFSFKPQFTPWIGVNELPTLPDDDVAIWDRLKPIPWKIRFYDTKEEAIKECGDPSRVKDSLLANKLESELPGILTWVIDGAVALRKEGLTTPSAVRNAANSYRTQMNPVNEFVTECCVLSPDAYVSRAELVAAFQQWSREAGCVFPEHEFSRKINTVVGSKPKPKRIKGSKEPPKRCWIGIGLKAEEEI